jgi:hypothetical protein
MCRGGGEIINPVRVDEKWKKKIGFDLREK